MKAITVWQPWAQLLAEGKKHDETRSWRTNYRGEILIHAAKKPYSQTERLMTAESRKKIRDTLGLGFVNWREKIPTGVIIGKAILTDCKLIDQTYHDFIKELCPEEFLYGDFTVGRYAWRLEKPQLFKNPIPASGKQGLWNWEPVFIKHANVGKTEEFLNEVAKYKEVFSEV